jgi:hypothetical protein
MYIIYIYIYIYRQGCWWEGYDSENFSLTLKTLTVCVIYTTVFEYHQNQVIFNATVFDGGPRCHVLTLAFGIQTKTPFVEY